jgi:hypothetical protein
MAEREVGGMLGFLDDFAGAGEVVDGNLNCQSWPRFAFPRLYKPLGAAF